MKLCFSLSMPGAPSWNGKWSGEGKIYAKIVDVRKPELAQTLIDGSAYYHRWDDGWIAKVNVSEVDAAMARKIRKSSKGFCGYDWMIGNIVSHGSTYNKPKGKS